MKTEKTIRCPKCEWGFEISAESEEFTTLLGFMAWATSYPALPEEEPEEVE